MKSIKNVKELWFAELRRLIKHPAAVLLLLALFILPSLYAWINIQALWDPYAHTNELKVAILSDDKTVTVLSDKQVNVGDTVVKTLKKNKKLDWQFVKTHKELVEGVRSGKYYAGLYLPQTFSKDLMSFTTGEVTKPAIEYTVNEKINAIAPKVTDKGATGLQEEIESSFAKEASSALFKVFNKIGFDIDSNWTSLEKVKDLILKADENLPTLDEDVQKLIAAQEKIPDINAKIAKANQAMTYLPEVDELGGKLLTLKQAMPELMNKASVLPTLEAKIPEIEQAAAQIAMLNADIGKMSDALDKGVVVMSAADDALAKAQAVLSTDDAKKTIATIQEEMKVAQADLEALQAIINKIDPSVLPPDIAAKLEAEIAEINTILTDMENVLGTLSKVDVVGTVTDIHTEVTNDLALLKKYQAQMPAIKQELSDANALLNAHLQEIVSGIRLLSHFYVNDMPLVAQKVAQASDFYTNDWQGIKTDLTSTMALINNQAPFVEQVVDEAADFVKNDWVSLRAGIQKAAAAIKKGEENPDIAQLLKALKFDANAESDFLASPVSIQTNQLYPIANYGSQSTPFYTALAIWVGAVLFSSVATTNYSLSEQQKRKGYTSRQRYMARALTFYAVGIVQGLVVVLGDIFLLHADVANKVAEIFFALFIALTFMSLIYMLVGLFGNIGKGLAIILLVLSIAAGGGNFPIAMSGKIFQVIHPFLPFTHAVNLLRESTGGIYAPNMWHAVLVLGVFLISSNILGVWLMPFMKPHIQAFHEKVHKAGIF
ncbi:MAG: YhgE/Pip domain-containing protein [Streptococcaceae bacterium]|jgi:putative membrane protein|nr:YhgE/Pip domain-containing protein [Streptococcaceae bacterium]